MAKKPKPTAQATAPIVGDPNKPGLCFDPNHPVALRVFCAALTGINANPEFFGPLFQQRPDLAVRHADDCVREFFQCIANDKTRDDPKGKP